MLQFLLGQNVAMKCQLERLDSISKITELLLKFPEEERKDKLAMFFLLMKNGTNVDISQCVVNISDIFLAPSTSAYVIKTEKKLLCLGVRVFRVDNLEIIYSGCACAKEMKFILQKEIVFAKY